MGQHLQPELRTVRAALGAQHVNAMEAIVALTQVRIFSSGTDIAKPSQQFCATFARQEALDDLELELHFVLLHATP